MSALLCLVKTGKQTQRGRASRPQIPAPQRAIWGSQAQFPVLHSLLCPAKSSGGGGGSRPGLTGRCWTRSPEATTGDGSQRWGLAGAGKGSWLPPLCLSVFRVVSPRDPLLALMLPSIPGPQPPLTARLSG